MYILIALVVILVLAYGSASSNAKRNHRKLVALMEHMDAQGKGREALDVVGKA